MIHKSIWEEENIDFSFPNEIKEKNVDVLIIGGGIAGIHTAYNLKDSRKKVAVIDKGKLLRGVTSKTTGKITYLQDLVYQNIEKVYDKKTSYQYFQSQKEAISLLLKNIEEKKINCDLQKVTSYTFSNKKNTEKDFEREKELLKEFDHTLETDLPFPLKVPYFYSLSAENTYVFHPLKYLNALIKESKDKISYYENITACEVKKDEDEYLISTNKGIIKAKSVVITTHYPFFIIPSFVPLKTYIENAYALAFKEKNKPFSAISYKDQIQSFRFQKDYLIYGGLSHSMAKTYNFERQKEKFISMYHSVFSKPIDYIWQTHDVMTDDHLPLIGKIQENMYLATGFNKWGMTNGTLAGKIISDLILENENEYSHLFDPKRSYNLKRMGNLIQNNLKTGKVYISCKLDRYRKPKGKAEVIKENGVWYGVYMDENGRQYKVYNKCPHMGCALTFNHFEKTWDCPCHGSRFDIHGKIIEGPSTYQISLPKEK